MFPATLCFVPPKQLSHYMTHQIQDKNVKFLASQKASYLSLAVGYQITNLFHFLCTVSGRDLKVCHFKKNFVFSNTVLIPPFHITNSLLHNYQIIHNAAVRPSLALKYFKYEVSLNVGQWLNPYRQGDGEIKWEAEQKTQSIQGTLVIALDYSLSSSVTCCKAICQWKELCSVSPNLLKIPCLPFCSSSFLGLFVHVKSIVFLHVCMNKVKCLPRRFKSYCCFHS